eukprot:10488464-Heterocapsa_arctica.AAC.1
MSARGSIQSAFTKASKVGQLLLGSSCFPSFGVRFPPKIVPWGSSGPRDSEVFSRGPGLRAKESCSFWGPS